ncbi:hypothetical protein TRVL_08004 [Trypanosoma vivax]|nr:hypothetical protein TRVL_08004 [Trypanosoma vivax]
MKSDRQPVNVLLLVTGSIAAVKIGLLLDQLSNEPCHIRIAATKSAFHFLKRAQQSTRQININHILTDDDEWKEWQGMNDAVMHIELRRWADFVVIVPLDANTLAKLAGGLCDNLVTCVMRAWEVKQKPVLVCPAMNTAMWIHPITRTQLCTLSNWYSGGNIEPSLPNDVSEVGCQMSQVSTLGQAMFQVIGPVKKRLACGDVGVGGMAPVEDIARAISVTADLIRSSRAANVCATPNSPVVPS